MAKRAFDVAVAVVGLVVTSPLVIALAIAVKLDSPGPAFYRGRRMGLGGRPFSIFKLRTMYVVPHGSDAPITVARDPRVTRIGQLLRRTKLDELPQLFNVLRGDMSLVGPRPEHPSYLKYYAPRHHALLSLRPGITSRASLAYRNEEELLSGGDAERIYVETVLPRKLDIDLDYIPHAGVRTDVSLLLETIVRVVRPGAYAAPPHHVPRR